MTWCERRTAVLAGAVIALVAPAVWWPAAHGEASSAQLPAMRLSKIQFDPPGDDDLTNSSLNKEWVQVHNYGVKPWTLTGWSLRDATGYKFVFPDDFTIQPGDTVTVHTGSGKDRVLHLYWGQGNYIWNNTGDKATLKNASGKVVDVCAYDGEGSSVIC
jgi:hypothetical protein